MGEVQGPAGEFAALAALVEEYRAWATVADVDELWPSRALPGTERRTAGAERGRPALRALLQPDRRADNREQSPAAGG